MKFVMTTLTPTTVHVNQTTLESIARQRLMIVMEINAKMEELVQMVLICSHVDVLLGSLELNVKQR